MNRRHIDPHVAADLKKKMVLLAGPRQCGKTTFAKQLLARFGGRYYNWDIPDDRRTLQAGRLAADVPLWVFDELHKYRSWRGWLKGVFDQHADDHSILVTGSARLRVYSYGGDSLQGRYFFYRLHPFTLSETLWLKPKDLEDPFEKLSRQRSAGSQEALKQLLVLGGFPEPFLSGSQKMAKRWRLAYGTLLVREDVRDLEMVRDLDRLELLYERLPSLVGSPLSINNLRNDLEVAFETAKSWLSIFENLYAAFRILPFGPPRIKAVKKEAKLYLWDWSRIEDEAARLENLVAVHLLRFCHWAEDVHGENVELRFFRNTVGHEVDFVLLRNKKPWVAIEVKRTQHDLDRGLKYFLERIKVPQAFQISLHGKDDWRVPDINGCRIRILPADRLLMHLP